MARNGRSRCTGWALRSDTIRTVSDHQATESAAPPEVSRLASGRHSVGPIERARRVWEYRELLGNLVRSELKGRYQDSLLGFLWTLLNPLLYLAVFTLVFTGFLRNTVPLYGLYLLCGLLAWNLFALGLASATTSIVANGSLVQKVWFPREILPLAAIGAAFVNFLFQLVVLVVGLIVFRRSPDWGWLWLSIPAVANVVLLLVAFGILLSALNVYFRDVQHFLELGLLAWFWVTPIVYQYDFVADRLASTRLGERAIFLNPMVSVVATLQRAIYNPTHEIGTDAEPFFDRMLSHNQGWWIEGLAFTTVFGLVILAIGLFTFDRLEANLGEEI